jgi:thioredoxin-like negative regulator of GroEL
MEQANAAAYSE